MEVREELRLRDGRKFRVGVGSGMGNRDRIRVKDELGVRFKAQSELGWSHVEGVQGRRGCKGLMGPNFEMKTLKSWGQTPSKMQRKNKPSAARAEAPSLPILLAPGSPGHGRLCLQTPPTWSSPPT